MQRNFVTLSAILLSLVFFACTAEEEVPVPEIEDTPALEDSGLILEEDLVTYNVTYSGILEEGGVTIYQQGTHHLMLSDGKMVLLEEPVDGEDVGLDLYVGKLVRARGNVMPTVEAGGTIMKLKEIVWIRRETNEDGEEEEVLRILCGGDAGVGCPSGYDCELTEDGSGMCGESQSDGEEGCADGSSAEGCDNEDVVDEENPDTPVDTGQSETITLMLDEDYADDRWIQEYCSTHVSFCVPVHKNWYFKSFGATASLLWHVEMGDATVENFGDGPLVVDLKSGDLAALGVTNGEVKTIGSRVIGYRSWSDGRHFEVSADASLVVPVTFVTQGLKENE